MIPPVKPVSIRRMTGPERGEKLRVGSSSATGRRTAGGGVLLGNDGGYLVPVPGAPLGPGRDEAVLSLLRNEKSKAAAGGLICSDQFL